MAIELNSRGGLYSKDELLPFIRETARKYGIDPDTAVRVAASEGLGSFQSQVRNAGGRETSYGAFQLYTGGGLGNSFQRDTGLDPSDPRNELATIDYALYQASRSGWGQWHGAARVGIGNQQGIGAPAQGPYSLVSLPEFKARGEIAKGRMLALQGLLAPGKSEELQSYMDTVRGADAIGVQQGVRTLGERAGVTDAMLAEKGVDLKAYQAERGMLTPDEVKALGPDGLKKGLAEGKYAQHGSDVFDPSRVKIGPESKKVAGIVKGKLDELKEKSPTQYAEIGQQFAKESARKAQVEQAENERRKGLGLDSNPMNGSFTLDTIIAALLLHLMGMHDLANDMMNGQGADGGSQARAPRSYSPAAQSGSGAGWGRRRLDEYNGGARTDAGLQARSDANRGAIPQGSITAVDGRPPAAFIFHHTAGRGDAGGVMNTLRQRGLGVQYIMERDGKIYQVGGPGEKHIMPGTGPGAGLSNANVVGMEIIAKDDSDLTPEQVKSAVAFMRERYPYTLVYGHGMINGHKQATEGMTVTNAVLADRKQQEQERLAAKQAEEQRAAATPSSAPAPAAAPARPGAVEAPTLASYPALPGLPVPMGANFHGSRATPQDLVEVKTAAGALTVHKDAATALGGFVNELHAQGAPISHLRGYVNRYAYRRDGTQSGVMSQHATGFAIDLNQRIDSSTAVTPEFKAWAQQHPEIIRNAQKRWNVVSGGDWKNPDFGHFEYNGRGINAPGFEATKPVAAALPKTTDALLASLGSAHVAGCNCPDCGSCSVEPHDAGKKDPAQPTQAAVAAAPAQPAPATPPAASVAAAPVPGKVQVLSTSFPAPLPGAPSFEESVKRAHANGCACLTCNACHAAAPEQGASGKQAKAQSVEEFQALLEGTSLEKKGPRLSYRDEKEAPANPAATPKGEDKGKDSAVPSAASAHAAMAKKSGAGVSA